MSRTLQNVIKLVERGEVRISAHGYDELAADDILVSDPQRWSEDFTKRKP